MPVKHSIPLVTRMERRSIFGSECSINKSIILLDRFSGGAICLSDYECAGKCVSYPSRRSKQQTGRLCPGEFSRRSIIEISSSGQALPLLAYCRSRFTSCDCFHACRRLEGLLWCAESLQHDPCQLSNRLHATFLIRGGPLQVPQHHSQLPCCRFQIEQPYYSEPTA